MLRKLCAVACILMVSCLIFASVAMAAEPPPGTVETEVVSAAAPWWLDIAEAVLNYLWQLIIPVGFAWLVKKSYDSAALKEAIQALEAGVNDAWVHFVRDLKKKAADGKLSDDEKVAARDWAKNKAMEIAKGPGKRVLAGFGQLAIDSLIEKIVRKNKAGG